MYRPKPPQLAPEIAAAFEDTDVVSAYRNRAPYPQELFTVLVDLIVGTPRAVLDVGCGPGSIARRLAPLVDRVDAVDVSPAMLALGCTLPDGDHPHLHWLLGRVEEIALSPPYSLVTAGASLHWMDWEIVLPRFADLLAPGGVLAIVSGNHAAGAPWLEEESAINRAYHTTVDTQPYDLLDELTTRGLFTLLGEHRCTPVPFTQSVADYIDGAHSHSNMTRARLGADRTAAVDAEMQALLAPYAEDGMLTFDVPATVRWGRPMHRSAV